MSRVAELLNKCGKMEWSDEAKRAAGSSLPDTTGAQALVVRLGVTPHPHANGVTHTEHLLVLEEAVTGKTRFVVDNKGVTFVDYAQQGGVTLPPCKPGGGIRLRRLHSYDRNVPQNKQLVLDMPSGKMADAKGMKYRFLRDKKQPVDADAVTPQADGKFRKNFFINFLVGSVTQAEGRSLLDYIDQMPVEEQSFSSMVRTIDTEPDLVQQDVKDIMGKDPKGNDRYIPPKEGYEMGLWACFYLDNWDERAGEKDPNKFVQWGKCITSADQLELSRKDKSGVESRCFGVKYEVGTETKVGPFHVVVAEQHPGQPDPVATSILVRFFEEQLAAFQTTSIAQWKQFGFTFYEGLAGVCFFRQQPGGETHNHDLEDAGLGDPNMLKGRCIPCFYDFVSKIIRRVSLRVPAEATAQWARKAFGSPPDDDGMVRGDLGQVNPDQLHGSTCVNAKCVTGCVDFLLQALQSGEVELRMVLPACGLKPTGWQDVHRMSFADAQTHLKKPEFRNPNIKKDQEPPVMFYLISDKKPVLSYVTRERAPLPPAPAPPPPPEPQAAQPKKRAKLES